MANDSSTQLQVWLDRLQAGDAAARAQLINRACERLRRLTLTMLRDFPRLRAYEEAEDVLQNAVLRLLRALDVVTPATTADFFRLAAQQIRRELLDLTRHYFGPCGQAAHAVPALSHDGPDSTPSGAVPSDSTFDPGRLARWTEFHRSAEALPEDERAVFDLIWYQGLTQAETAEVLRVSAATVKRRWVAARLHLQDVCPMV